MIFNEVDRAEIENLPIVILREAHIIEDEHAIGVETFIRQPHVGAPSDSPESPPSSGTDSNIPQSLSNTNSDRPTGIDAAEDFTVFSPLSFQLLNPNDDEALNCFSLDEVGNAAIAELLRVSSTGANKSAEYAHTV